MAKTHPIRDLVKELHRRAREGFENATFKLAFWVGVVLCGGLGVWFEVYHLIKFPLVGNTPKYPSDWVSLRTALGTFFPAIIGAASLQMVLEDNIKSHRTIAVCILILFLLLIMPINDKEIPVSIGILLGILASAVSLWVWCAANGLSATYQQDPDIGLGEKSLDASLPGGDALSELIH